MGLTQMKFDKVWTNPVDFPTYEAHEAKVREDMQYLFDAIKNQFNHFLANELTAGNISFDPTVGEIEVTNVQAAIEAVHQEVQDITQGSVADGSITAAKLCQTENSEAVVTAAIRNGAITTAKIADGAVTADKLASGALDTGAIADGAITQVKMAISSVGTDQLIANCVTDGKLANGAVITQRIADAAVTADKLAADAVVTAKILDGNVTADKLAANAVVTAKIRDGNVTTVKIANSAVTTAKIADSAVTYAKTSGVQKVHTSTTTSLASGAHSWTKSVSGVTASNVVICTPAPASYAQWVDNRVRCSGQAAGSLTFTADTNTSAAITVNILILD